MAAAAQIGPWAVGVWAIASAAAILYRVPLLPRTWQRRCLRDWPGSKDALVAAAWAFVVVGMMVLASDGCNLSVKKIAGAAAIVFLLTYVKTVMLDLRDMESDHLLGIETLPVWLGKARAISLLVFLHWFLLAFIAFVALVSGGTFAYLFILVPLYGILALRALARSGFKGETDCQIIMDGQLLFAGLLAFLHKTAENFL
ncbi:MAG: UbiA family prenyltransferase [Planctomycetota bacterium]|nr:UbiA family prenyltransferase [Planctomycetota bacterium]